MDASGFAIVESALAAKRLSVAQLCRRAEVAESTWNRMKSGRTGRVRQATLGQLRRAFEDLTGDKWPLDARPQPRAA